MEVGDNSLFSYNEITSSVRSHEVVISGDDRPEGMVNQMGDMSLVKAREGDSGSVQELPKGRDTSSSMRRCLGKSIWG